MAFSREQQARGQAGYGYLHGSRTGPRYTTLVFALGAGLRGCGAGVGRVWGGLRLAPGQPALHLGESCEDGRRFGCSAGAGRVGGGRRRARCLGGSQPAPRPGLFPPTALT